MTRYLIDTSILAATLHNRSSAAVEFVHPLIISGQATTSILVYGEITEYLKGLPAYPDHAARLRALLRIVPPLSLTYPILERYADSRRTLRPPFGPGLIGDIDTLIAATALEHDLTAVTSDSDFRRVPGLQLHFIPR